MVVLAHQQEVAGEEGFQYHREEAGAGEEVQHHQEVVAVEVPRKHQHRTLAFQGFVACHPCPVRVVVQTAYQGNIRSRGMATDQEQPPEQEVRETRRVVVASCRDVVAKVVGDGQDPEVDRRTQIHP